MEGVKGISNGCHGVGSLIGSPLKKTQAISAVVLNVQVSSSKSTGWTKSPGVEVWTSKRASWPPDPVMGYLHSAEAMVQCTEDEVRSEIIMLLTRIEI